MLKQKKITEGDIRLPLSAEEDYRITTRPYHTYSSEKQKTARVDIKGVPEYMAEEEIKEKMQRQ